ncbi:hypothetical protein XM38_017210 [Halomicronema hongdechloris C2206]|uniref:SCP domain-containing protein n=1 Tax=Halomicronema hongdechloris C2206 TaxID=1641165 RepID=A0A1Z3HKD2_9CYAN|nr:CAP domain-containing protein [Halomicronema hongdechloris]ASC70774.1 hypothetical protein XM38_017210 [Halomicronema hongdechloris C2206]
MGVSLKAIDYGMVAAMALALIAGPGNALADSEATVLLEAHNRYREDVGVPPLAWSPPLAESAQAWAEHLAATNSFAHSAAGGYGENIWKGTAGAYELSDMVDSWGAEKQYFVSDGVFPAVATTGNWRDVGHYTQIIWRQTTEVGCGLASGQGWDVLVCQYTPPGNYIGQPPL